jgi:hypothetical protein
MQNTRLANTLQCLFDGLSIKYPESQLTTCKVGIQKYRHASGLAARERVKLFIKYFPELSLLCDSLENYSICEKHYNQIIVTDNFLEKLKKANDTSEETSQQKKLRHTLSIPVINSSSEEELHKFSNQATLPNAEITRLTIELSNMHEKLSKTHEKLLKTQDELKKSESQRLYTHLPKVSGQNVDHVNFRDIFMCFTQKYSKTNEKTRLFVLSNHTSNVRNCIFPLIFIT